MVIVLNSGLGTSLDQEILGIGLCTEGQVIGLGLGLALAVD